MHDPYRIIKTVNINGGGDVIETSGGDVEFLGVNMVDDMAMLSYTHSPDAPGRKSFKAFTIPNNGVLPENTFYVDNFWYDGMNYFVFLQEEAK